MYARVASLGGFALDGFVVTVEADLSGGLPSFELVSRQVATKGSPARLPLAL